MNTAELKNALLSPDAEIVLLSREEAKDFVFLCPVNPLSPKFEKPLRYGRHILGVNIYEFSYLICRIDHKCPACSERHSEIPEVFNDELAVKTFLKQVIEDGTNYWLQQVDIAIVGKIIKL